MRTNPSKRLASNARCAYRCISPRDILCAAAAVSKAGFHCAATSSTAVNTSFSASHAASPCCSITLATWSACKDCALDREWIIFSNLFHGIPAASAARRTLPSSAALDENIIVSACSIACAALPFGFATGAVTAGFV